MHKRKSTQLFHKYFAEWVELYKVGSVRDVTLKKYKMTHRHIKLLAPRLKNEPARQA